MHLLVKSNLPVAAVQSLQMAEWSTEISKFFLSWYPDLVFKDKININSRFFQLLCHSAGNAGFPVDLHSFYKTKKKGCYFEPAGGHTITAAGSWAAYRFSSLKNHQPVYAILPLSPAKGKMQGCVHLQW